MWNTQRKKETKKSWWAPPHPTPPPQTPRHRSLKSTGRQDSELWEISMSKKILCKVVVILRFGCDTPALLDKLSALTPPWNLFYPFAPQPGNPLISPPLPACARLHVAKIPTGRKNLFLYTFIKRLPLQSRLDENSRWSFLPQTWQAMTLCTWGLFIQWWINVNYAAYSFEKSQLTPYTVVSIFN